MGPTELPCGSWQPGALAREDSIGLARAVDHLRVIDLLEKSWHNFGFKTLSLPALETGQECSNHKAHRQWNGVDRPGKSDPRQKAADAATNQRRWKTEK